MDIRIHDAGIVSHLRSQTIYHGLAHARTDESPDTIVIATPETPYVCIGFHQDVERELDLEFCEAHGLPILRRETGGGAVYLDSDQLFVQWIMGSASLPARVEDRFELFARPLVDTYREFGIDAEFRPVNDVHVDGRKISGTGAARVGNAEVLVGNFIFDFDTEVMASVLAAPSPMFREQVDASLRRYMTSMRNEGVPVPDVSDVVRVYRGKCEAAFGRKLVDGPLTSDEIIHIEELDRRLGSPGFVRQPGGLRRPGVKIHEDVHVVESTHEGKRLTARLRAGRIEEVVFSGDGSARMESAQIQGLAAALRGVELSRDPVHRAVATYYAGSASTSAAMITSWVDAILELRNQPQGT
jgi:lipoate---protein ligase